MSVQDRIDRSHKVPFIPIENDLPILSVKDDMEDKIYHGCGRVLASFKHGKLTDLFYAHGYNNAWTATDEAVKWAKGRRDVWLAEASCYTLCNPRKVNVNDSDDRARIMQAFKHDFDSDFS